VICVARQSLEVPVKVVSRIVAVMVVLNLVASATVSAQADAATTYAQKCVMCHGKTGAGDGVAAAALNPKPPDFTTAEFHKARTDEALIEVVTNGKSGMMPAYESQLSADEIKAIVAYLRTLGKPEGT
jgi:mono/diheme cytochrome c family protein